MEFFADHGTHLQLKAVLEEIFSLVFLLQSQLELSSHVTRFSRFGKLTTLKTKSFHANFEN